MVGISKQGNTKSCLAIENDEHRCSDYSLLFSMPADDDEQHFQLTVA